jgi:hypothetical protein
MVWEVDIYLNINLDMVLSSPKGPHAQRPACSHLMYRLHLDHGLPVSSVIGY